MARRKHTTTTIATSTPAVGIAIGFEPNPYGRDPVAPRRFFGSQSQPNIDFPGLVGAGENDLGFTSQGPNGTQHVSGNGNNQSPWDNWNRKANGRRWTPPVDWAKNGGNRTGE